MSKRVLIVGEYGSLNGGENSWLAIAPSLAQLGWEFHAAVPTRTHFSIALNSIGIETADLSIRSDDGQRKSQTEIRQHLAEIIRHSRPDLIHCNSLSLSRLMGPVTGELQTPSLGYIRDILKLSKKAVADINELDRLIAVSNATRDFHIDQGINADKTFVVYNGVDSNVFCSQNGSQAELSCPIRNEFNIDSSSPILLSVGQIGIRKGVDTTVEAFLDVAETIPNAHLMIVGQRHSQKQEAVEFETRIRKMARLSSFNEQIHWLGNRTDVADLMRAASVLVHLARQEPLGRVLLESAASGLPIVTTRVGGSSEILTGRTLAPFLVQPNDTSVAAQRILSLIQNSELHHAVGTLLKSEAEQRFSIGQCVKNLNRHYRELVGN